MSGPAPGAREKRSAKMARLPVEIGGNGPSLPKPPWIRITLPRGDEVARIKRLLRSARLNTVCEEASCPNLPECFGQGTATFMVMGDLCTRRCPFCDVAHGRPMALDPHEPASLAEAVAALGLRFVVITSVDRDDLRDGGAAHISACVAAVRSRCPDITVETLVPDFRGRMERALDAIDAAPADVFSHNLETVPRLYRKVRPGASYEWSLSLLARFGERHPRTPTKSGLMLGLGESRDEVVGVMRDLVAHGCRLLTVGQYLQPSPHHLPVARYVPPSEFDELAARGREIGFAHVASGPLVRSSYHADRQARAAGLVRLHSGTADAGRSHAVHRR